METGDPVFADVVLDFFGSGEGPIAGPYGGTFPGTFPVPVSTSVVLGSDGSTVDFLSLPTGSFVTVGFTSATIIDGLGNDIFIQEVSPNGELANVFVSSDGVNFEFLGLADDGVQTAFDLGSIGFTDPVTAVKIEGLDNRGGSPGFDVVNVQGLPGSFNLAPLAGEDSAETARDTAVDIAVLGNDSDTDGDAFGIDAIGAPSNGTAAAVGDSIRYTPDTGFSGTDSFTYTIRDARGAEASATVTVTVGSGLPDLVPTVAAESTLWEPGDEVLVTSTVTNSGTGDTESGFGATLVLSTDTVLDDDDAILEFRNLGPLTAGANTGFTSVLSVDALFDSGFAPGTYFVGLRADSFGQVEEETEGNNTTSVAITLATPVDGDGADLIVSDISFSDTDWMAGETVSYSGVVSNIGDADADLFDVGIYLGEDGEISNADIFLAFDELGPLEVGASEGFAGTFAVDDVLGLGLAIGDYFAGAVADDFFDVEESNEANNGSVGIAVSLGDTGPDLPDLVFEALSLSDSAWNLGDRVTISGTIRNRGDVATPEGGFTWEAALDPSGTLFTAGPAVVASSVTSSIPAGGSIGVATTIDIDDAILARFAPGSYALAALVDTGGAVAEADEGNNVSDTAVIEIDTAGQPDLLLENVALAGPTVTGGTVTFSVDARNLGGSLDEELTVDFVASRDPVLTANDQLLAVGLLSDGLGADSTERVVRTEALDLAPGTYFVGALADPENEIDETDETNNASEVQSITVPENLFLDFETAIPLSAVIHRDPETGEQFYVFDGGALPIGNFSAAFRDQIIAETQAIFDRSGVPINVTGERPNSGDFNTVRFSQPLPSYDSNGDGTANSTLLGLAYEGLDRFDKNKNNSNAVFMDESLVGGGTSMAAAALDIAETVAHETGHSYGLRHINPVLGPSSEVMDYQASAAPAFHQGVADMFEPPFDDNRASLETTHNPVYHLRRFLGGESDADLQAAGIRPGTWDVPRTITFWGWTIDSAKPRVRGRPGR